MKDESPVDNSGIGLDSKLISMRYEEVKQKLLEKVANESIFHRDIILPNGQIADICLDVKESFLSAEGVFLTSLAILHNISDDVEAIGANIETSSSIPSTTSLLAYVRGQKIDCFYVKNQPRQVGFSKWIQGPLKQGAKICLIQDMISDSDAVVDLVRKVKEESSAQILQVIGLVDISKHAATRFFDIGINYTPIIKLKEIIDILPDSELLVQEKFHAQV